MWFHSPHCPAHTHMIIQGNPQEISALTGRSVSLRTLSKECCLIVFVDFEVTTKLPNITFPLSRSFAGNLPVNRPGHPNDTLFFYAFEKSFGSLTAPSSSVNRDPWGIWLNGGLVSLPKNFSDVK